MHDLDTVTLRPTASAIVPWTALGVVVSGLALWTALDAGTSLLAWLFVGLCLVATSYVAVPLLAPSRFEVRLDDRGVEVSLPWQHHRVAWDRVHLARVVRVVGEPVLELHVWDTDRVTRSSRAMGILLPIGADLPALHRVLEARLGRWDPDVAAQPEPV